MHLGFVALPSFATFVRVQFDCDTLDTPTSTKVRRCRLEQTSATAHVGVHTEEQRSGLAVSAVAALNEASDLAFPTRDTPAVETRAPPADQSKHGEEHRLPGRVGDTDRVHAGP